MTNRKQLALKRGAIDAYYGHSGKPRIVLDALGNTIVLKTEMSKEEIKAYWKGYDDQIDRKEWD
jgi:hypothetical protein